MKSINWRISFSIIIIFTSITSASAQNLKKSLNGSISEKEVNILDFGAIDDGITLCTEAIQSAIDSIHKNGGGKVVIPRGSFLTGSIVIKSDVELHFHNNAILIGSTDPNQYKKIEDHLALILADNSKNIALNGNGIIDGQGLNLALVIDSLHHTGKEIDPEYNYRRMRSSGTVRPQIINFTKCSNVLVKNVTIKDGSGWITKYKQCYKVLIDSIKISSTAFWNNDGIDICDSKKVSITNSFINSADDGICLKSYSKEFFNDSIYIGNCTIRSSASAIKFGTDSYGGFTNIKIEKIKVYDTFRSAIALESVDGGIIENIQISDIEAENTGNAIFIRLGHRNQESPVGSVQNVSIKNLRAAIPFERPDKNYDLRGPDLPFFHNTFPASVTGIPGYYVENIHLENIEIIYPGRGTKGMAYAALYRLDQIPEQENEYPEFSMFGELPAWGFYARHVEGIKMENISLRVQNNDYRPAFVFDDVKNTKLKNTKIFTKDNHHQVVLNNVIEGEFTEIEINGKKDFDTRKMGNCISIKED